MDQKQFFSCPSWIYFKTTDNPGKLRIEPSASENRKRKKAYPGQKNQQILANQSACGLANSKK